MTLRLTRATGLIAVMSCAAWSCGSSSPSTAAPPAAEQPGASEPATTSESAAHVEPATTPEPGAAGPRRLTVSWDALADPHSSRTLIVRTDMEWEELFVGAVPDRTIDFRRSLVVGLAEPDVPGVRIDEVRVAGGEVVVTATVSLPNARCGETPVGSVDMMVIEYTDLPIRFEIDRSPTEC